MTIRAIFLDFDARPEPKTNRFCAKCQRDIKPGSPTGLRWHKQTEVGCRFLRGDAIHDRA